MLFLSKLDVFYGGQEIPKMLHNQDIILWNDDDDELLLHPQ